MNAEGGAVELLNYDINADVGPTTAVVKEYLVPVDDGTLNLAFSAQQDQPKIAAIEVLQTSLVPPTVTPTVASSQSITT